MRLTEYITEAFDGLDKVHIWHGTRMMNQLMHDRLRLLISRYKISPNDPNPGILRWQKATNDNIPVEKDEYIPRKDWDLESLYGESEYQIMHPHFYEAAQQVYKTYKRKHDVLLVHQCSSKKPYANNEYYKKNITSYWDDLVDLAVVSNPGIIPYESSYMYPYRYYDYVTKNEKHVDVNDIDYKYFIITMCRIIKFKREAGYKHLVFLIPNQKLEFHIRELVRMDVDGAEDWLHIVLDQQTRNKVAKAYPGLAKQGFICTRLPQMKETKKRLARVMSQFGPEFEKRAREVIKEFDVNEADYELKERGVDNKYEVLDLKPADVVKAFKKHIEDNMATPVVDKGDNKLYYKSYYWTTLDLIMLALDGNLTEDIDKLYWDLQKYLDERDEWVNFGKYCWIYQPLNKNDDVDIATCTEEALKYQIIQDTSEPKLNDAIIAMCQKIKDNDWKVE